MIIKTFEAFNNNINQINSINYSIEYSYSENRIYVLAKVDTKIVGQLSIIDDTDLYDDDDDEKEFNILTANVIDEYKRQGIYINLLKYFLKNNTYGVTKLTSEKETSFDEIRSSDADMFWKVIYKNQKKYGVKIEKYGNDYTISLK